MKSRRLKANGLQDRALFAYTFDTADNDNPAIKYAHRYVKHWAEVKAEGQGLLFWGGVGTGKTFAAACIANALSEQGIPVLMTNFSKILNSLSGMFSEDRNKYLASFGEFDLLVIDDLGIERNLEDAQEQVYNVVDSRYLSRLPFIITTNLTLAELKDPKDIAHARIYDRILERWHLSVFRAETTAPKMRRTPRTPFERFLQRRTAYECREYERSNQRHRARE